MDAWDSVVIDGGEGEQELIHMRNSRTLWEESSRSPAPSPPGLVTARS